MKEPALNKRRKHIFWNSVGVAFSLALSTFFFTRAPTPKQDCVPFEGTLEKYQHVGRSTVYAVLQTDQGKRRYRTNSRLIGKSFYSAEAGTLFSGLVDQHENVVAFYLNSKPIVDYDSFYKEEQFVWNCFGWLSLAVALWSTTDAIRWTRRNST